MTQSSNTPTECCVITDASENKLSLDESVGLPSVQTVVARICQIGFTVFAYFVAGLLTADEPFVKSL